MSIITGKSLAAALAALAVAAGVQAQEKVLYSENFEEAIPGQTPKKWTKVWGSPGSDIFAVTNEKSAGGDNALLLTRGAGDMGGGVTDEDIHCQAVTIRDLQIFSSLTVHS